jgi:hypothetical protein
MRMAEPDAPMVPRSTPPRRYTVSGFWLRSDTNPFAVTAGVDRDRVSRLYLLVDAKADAFALPPGKPGRHGSRTRQTYTVSGILAEVEHKPLRRDRWRGP